MEKIEGEDGSLFLIDRDQAKAGGIVNGKRELGRNERMVDQKKRNQKGIIWAVLNEIFIFNFFLIFTQIYTFLS